MRFVFIMDPMSTVTHDKDTSYAFQRAAQNRDHEPLHCLPRDVFVLDGELFARVRKVQIKTAAPYWELGEEQRVRLADCEAVFIRKDPPFDQEYLYLTLLLERVRGRVLIVNDPRGLREANEKLYAIHFKQFMPKTLVSARRDEIIAFAESLGSGGRDAVIKPLDGAGGAGVLMLRHGDKNVRSIVDIITQEGKRYAMVQEFLPRVTEGDKRVLLLDGRILGAVNRVPRSDDLRSNIHAGGSVAPTELTSEERAIVRTISPRLVEDGLFFVGLDMIGGKLTEVNVTSPTCIQELSAHVGRDVAAEVIVWTETRAAAYRPSLRSIPPD